MRTVRTLLLLSLSAAWLLALGPAGCVHHHHRHARHDHVKAHGPPPWAPAHGYRHHHHGVDLVFDAGIGVYVVSGHADHFFHRDHYYRLHDGHWQWADHLRGPWIFVASSDVPPGLRKHHGKHAPGRHRGKHGKKH